jgi:hypothetical protein
LDDLIELLLGIFILIGLALAFRSYADSKFAVKLETYTVRRWQLVQVQDDQGITLNISIDDRFR